MWINTPKEVFEYTGNGQIIPKDVVRVRFHPSVVKVDDKAFYKCNRLKEVILNEGLQYIGQDAFGECTSLTNITLPSTVTEIGMASFYECKKLKTICLNENLLWIGDYAFNRCDSLESITLPSTVMDIGNSAFSKCISLNEVVLNEGLMTIGTRVFEDCKSLQSISLPSTLIKIASNTFSSCNSLREIRISESLLKVDTINLFLDPPSITFHHKPAPSLERITLVNISLRLKAIIRAGQVDIQNKLQQCINQSDMIEWERGGGGEIYIPVEVTKRGWGLVKDRVAHIVSWIGYQRGAKKGWFWKIDTEETRIRDEWDTTKKQSIDRIDTLIRYYEMKEATTLFELALWKAKMDQVEDGVFRTRDECRVDVPGPVKDSILHYLYGSHLSAAIPIFY